MSEDGAIPSSGCLARDVDEMLDASSSVTLETVVCRGAETDQPVLVERRLEDGLANAFAPMTIAEADDPGAQATSRATGPARFETSATAHECWASGSSISKPGRRPLGRFLRREN